MPDNIPEQTPRQSRRKVRQGVVVSTKLDKSVVVEVVRTVSHPLYKKVIRRGKKFMAHDEENSCAMGDLVRIMECRPMSRRKRWRLLEVVKKAE